ncbi:MAG: hypothetical protein NC191_07985 [Muribaculaceae bacterium]|nr:hypothetical protein [Muribaculaceae bacterium]
MKTKILTGCIFLSLFSCTASAKTPNEAIEFFKQYTDYANSYNQELLNMYSPNAKIIREVVKPTGETVDITVPPTRYFKELKIGQKTAKLRRYKNKYRNITATKVPNGIKISAERQPAKETYWLKMYQIVQNTDKGFKITEEMMQTKVQSFLKHQENKQ